MPSTIEHCQLCPFAPLEEADEQDAFIEDAYVKDHVVILEHSAGATRIDESAPLIAPERLLAARGCAKLIREGTCRRFRFLYLRGITGNIDQVMIVERGDAND